jgi:hypothetical protein
VTAVFGLFLAASLTVLVVGSWRIARGPGRLRAATWLLLGVAPALIATGHFLYGLRLNSSRLIVLDLPIKLLIPFGESIMDLEARFRYPERTEGETVVMIAASGRFPPRRSRRRPCSTARSSSRRRRTCPGRIRGPSPTGIQRRWRRGSRRSSPG